MSGVMCEKEGRKAVKVLRPGMLYNQTEMVWTCSGEGQQIERLAETRQRPRGRTKTR